MAQIGASPSAEGPSHHVYVCKHMRILMCIHIYINVYIYIYLYIYIYYMYVNMCVNTVCIAAWCSMLQCGAACCSVLQVGRVVRARLV